MQDVKPIFKIQQDNETWVEQERDRDKNSMDGILEHITENGKGEDELYKSAMYLFAYCSLET